jgi:hypothetical protein
VTARALRPHSLGHLIIAAIVLATGSAAFGRILKTRSAPSQSWNPWLPITIGSGFEFETDKDQSQYDFPFLLEYNFTETLKLTVEPLVSHIAAKAKDVRTVTGMGDLETSIEYEFIRERRYRPALTALGVIRWPTHTDPDIGNPGRDYSLGIIASKDLVFLDVDLTALYTFVGDPEGQDTFEIALAGLVPLNHFFDIEGEVVHSFGTGGIRGQPGTLSGAGGAAAGADLTEGTIGVAWHISKRLKVEAGSIFRSDNTWQIVFAWEWSFTGD